MIIISKTLTLGDWYQPKHIVTGEAIREWVIQDINIPELKSLDLHSIDNNISYVCLFPNILNTLGVSFSAKLLSLRETFSTMYNTTDQWIYVLGRN